MVRELDRAPLLRGWSHALAVIPATAGAALLVIGTSRTGAERAALALYGAALILLFAVSALYHRGAWSPRARAVWRRVDHANIFLMIAATYTAVGVIVLDGITRAAILAAVWAAAAAGIVLTVLPIRMPRGVTVLLYIVTGWIAVVVLPSLVAKLSVVDLALLFSGALLYTLGALTYGLRWPRLWPRVFGYHEVFHLLVIAATAVLFTLVAAIATPGGRL